jgi:hypothetical protein
VAKSAKTHSGSASRKIAGAKPPLSSTPQKLVGTQGQNTIDITSASAQQHIVQNADDKKKGTTEDEPSKEVLANPTNPEKKLKIGANLNPK